MIKIAQPVSKTYWKTYHNLTNQQIKQTNKQINKKNLKTKGKVNNNLESLQLLSPINSPVLNYQNCIILYRHISLEGFPKI